MDRLVIMVFTFPGEEPCFSLGDLAVNASLVLRRVPVAVEAEI
jgi:hypothetical protein